MDKTILESLQTWIKEDDVLSTKERNDLPDNDFGIPSKRAFPMPDAEHVRNAIARFHFADDKDKSSLAKKIMDKAKKFGVDVGDDSEVSKWAIK